MVAIEKEVEKIEEVAGKIQLLIHFIFHDFSYFMIFHFHDFSFFMIFHPFFWDSVATMNG